MYLFVSDIQTLGDERFELLQNSIRDCFRDETRNETFYVLINQDFELAQFYYPNATIKKYDGEEITAIYLA